MPPTATASDRPFWVSAARWLAVCGPGFFIVYGTCNAINAHRTGVGTFVFEWERHLPFVPWMILPYMSIDVFFAGAFFLCRDRNALHALGWRILLAFGISAVGFMLFPLRYAWPRPPVEGWPALFFAPLEGFDKPYNLCPSMHISLWAILWRVYGPATRPWPWLWAAAGTWFVMIALSTLLIYQHHFIDLIGGWLVAHVCCALVPESRVAGPPSEVPISPNPTLCPSPPSFTKAPPRFWPRWSRSSPATACAGSAAVPTPASASTSPTTPATSTPSSSGPPSTPKPAR